MELTSEDLDRMEPAKARSIYPTSPNNWKELSERTQISEYLLEDFDRWARLPPAYTEPHRFWMFYVLNSRSPIVLTSFDIGGDGRDIKHSPHSYC